MKRITKWEQIFYHSRRIGVYTETKWYTWGDVRKMLEDKQIVLQNGDRLEIAYRDEDSSHEDAHTDACYYVSVARQREETDQEFEKRKKANEEGKERNRKARYESYLKLKEEFENEKI